MSSSHDLAPYGLPELSELAFQQASIGKTSTTQTDARRQVDQQTAETLLWQRYIESRDPEIREQLILLYMPYGKIVAAGLYGKHTYHETSFDEYVQWATLGMIEAIDRYDMNKGARFKTYALPRMQGAIRDGLENISERQQQLSLQRRLLAERVAAIKHKAKPDLTSRLLESLSEIGMGLALSFILDDTGMLLSEEASLPDHCYATLELKQLRERVREMLKGLTPREQSVVKLHYLQGLTFDDVGKTLRITKGRVSQLHDQALGRLLKILTHSSCKDVFL